MSNKPLNLVTKVEAIKMTTQASDVLIVEDTGSVAKVMQNWLIKAGITAEIAESGADALKIIERGSVKAILLDLQLPDMNGLEILDFVQQNELEISVVVVTSSGSITTAVDAMRRGAYDFIVKPASQERLLTTTKNALEREVLQKAVRQIRTSFKKGDHHGFIGSSLPMIAVYKTIEAVARSKASVFVTGESGTGKEVCAQAIHQASPRNKAPFIALNCAAIPKELIESEIFGHVKGSFTGATSDRVGAAVSANGGTLFLDEICEMDLDLQSKLLRFLQTGTVQKVGSDKLEKIDVRIVCATNRNPLIEVEEGRFREDLYYRLHVVPIELPPLRARESDVIEIGLDLVTNYSKEEEKEFKGFTSDAEDALLNHNWPGNVRELQNVIRNAIILNDGEEIDASMLNFATRLPKSNGEGSTSSISAGVIEKSANSNGLTMSIDLENAFADIEREIIEAAINACDGSIPKASEMLQLSPSTIYRKKESWSD